MSAQTKNYDSKGLQSAKPQIHGHRGARGHFPENTLDSVRFAIQSGAHAAEVDLCVSKDDVVVVHHDLALSPDIAIGPDNIRITTPIPIRKLLLRELERYDVGSLRPGSKYAARFAQQKPLPRSRIPTLDQFIEYVLKFADEDFILNLELKGDPDHPELIPSPRHYVSLVLHSIASYQITRRTFIQSFDWRLIKLVQRQAPEILAGLVTDLTSAGHHHLASTGHDDPWTDGWSLADFDNSMPLMVASAGAPVWSTNYLDLSPKLVDEAHALNLRVYAYTVNEEADMKKLIEWGVDAITTDYPDRLVKILAA
ncbi:MAG: glycerophosphodiester phosphodiesterase family protein [Arenicellales bacterium]